MKLSKDILEMHQILHQNILSQKTSPAVKQDLLRLRRVDLGLRE